MRSATVIALMASLMAACTSEDLLADLADAGPADGGLCVGSAEGGPIVYINAAPTTISPGMGDSAGNTSPIVDAIHSTAGWDATGGELLELEACVQQLVGPLSARVTTTEPATEHVELVVTQSAEELGLSPTIFSIAPNSCGQNRRAMGFVFAGMLPAQEICYQVGWTLGAVAGASHSFDCRDVMSALQPCGDGKTFVDDDVECGQFEAEDCLCSGEATQNTRQIIDDFFAGYCEGGA